MIPDNAAIISLKLRAGNSFEPGERMAGHWMLWAARNEAHLGSEPRYEWHYERIRSRQGDLLIGEHHTRRYTHGVLVMARDYDLDAYWPRWESGGAQGLSDEELRRVLSAAIEAAEE